MSTRTPTDRGVAFIKNNPDGTSSVYVAADVAADGSPQDVISMHLNRPGVDIDGAIRLVSAGSMRRTAGQVRVSSGPEDVVLVKPGRSGMGPLLG